MSAPLVQIIPLLLVLAGVWAHNGLDDCTFPMTTRPGDSCALSWSDMKPYVRPTQFGVGFAAVKSMFDKHFSSKSDAQDYLDKRVVPVVLGPNKLPYLLDHHHTLCSLDLSGYNSVKVTLIVSCDLSALSEQDFWAQMEDRQFAFLLQHPPNLPNALYVKGDHTQLPLTVEFSKDGSSLTDDPWRTLSGFVQDVESDDCPKSNKGCQRGYEKACNQDGHSIPYIEFRWAYLMNLGLFNSTLWDTQDQYSTFSRMFARLPSPALPQYVDLSLWQDTAASLVPLCRSSAAGRFQLPSVFGSLQGSNLPGYFPASSSVPPDPSCLAPLCPSLPSALTSTKHSTTAPRHSITPTTIEAIRKRFAVRPRKA